MLVATRVMYLFSGVLVLATGFCIEARFSAQLPELLRMSILWAALAYFGWRLWRFLSYECRVNKPAASTPVVRKLGLDFIRQ